MAFKLVKRLLGCAKFYQPLVILGSVYTLDRTNVSLVAAAADGLRFHDNVLLGCASAKQDRHRDEKKMIDFYFLSQPIGNFVQQSGII